jgi:hypothetical protein
MKLSRLKISILGLLSLLLLLSGLATSNATPTWNIQTPDTQGIVGAYCSIALDSHGNPHISYQGYNTHNSTLKYASYNGNTWKIETVDSQDWAAGSYTSLALDQNGYPHISYIDDRISQLKYAYWTGTKWSIEEVDSYGNAGSFSSIALDSHANPYIAYHRGGQGLEGSLKLAHWTGSVWSIETVDPGAQGNNPLNVGQYCSLVIDSHDKPHISYLGTGAGSGPLKYASWTGTTWDINTIPETTYNTGYSDIALDSNDKPSISYVTTVPGADFKPGTSHPSYAAWNGSGWTTESVDLTTTNCLYTSLTLNSQGTPCISYEDFRSDSTRHLEYATKTNSGWNKVEVDPSAADYSDLALDSGNNPHISYYDPLTQDLKYATFTEKYQMKFSQTGLNNSNDTLLIVDSANNYKAADLPITFIWNKGTNHAFSYLSPLNAGSSNSYVWTQTTGLSTGQSGTLPITQSGNVSALYQLNQVSFTLHATKEGGETVDFAVTGNMSSSQISNLIIASNQTLATTTITFTITGETGTAGFGNLTVPKNAVAYGTTPTIYVDNQIIQNQGFSQDSNNYYVWYSTHFSTHKIAIVFSAATTTPTPSSPASPIFSPSPSVPELTPAIIIALLTIVTFLLFIISRRIEKPRVMFSLFLLTKSQ